MNFCFHNFFFLALGYIDLNSIMLDLELKIVDTLITPADDKTAAVYQEAAPIPGQLFLGGGV